MRTGSYNEEISQTPCGLAWRRPIILDRPAKKAQKSYKNTIAAKEIDPAINPPNAAILYPFKLFSSPISSVTFLCIFVLNIPAMKNSCIKNKENDATSMNDNIG